MYVNIKMSSRRSPKESVEVCLSSVASKQQPGETVEQLVLPEQFC